MEFDGFKEFILSMLQIHVKCGYKKEEFIFAWNSDYVYINAFNYAFKIDLHNNCLIECLLEPSINSTSFYNLTNYWQELSYIVKILDKTISAYANDVLRCKMEKDTEILLIETNGIVNIHHINEFGMVF